MKDYPEVGVCKWREWSQTVACWLMDPHKGNLPASLSGWHRYRHILRSVRQPANGNNLWHRYFARYSMTPWEAFFTMRKRKAKHPPAPEGAGGHK